MTAPFDFDFATRAPGPPLAAYCEALWFARGTIPYTRERIAPTGSTVAVVVLGDPIIETADDGDGASVTTDRGFLVGPHTRPVINEPTGETFAVGVVGTPVGCEALFGVPPSRIKGGVALLEDTWPAAVALRPRLLAAPDKDAMLDVLEAFLVEHLAPAPPGLARCARAVALLEAEPTRPIAAVAEELGISHAHLDREFTRVVGITPRALARLLRMRRLLAAIDVQRDVGWADLAADLGWFDQAHLIRDFKRHTGVTPSQYLAAQRAQFSPVEAGDAAGFVPE